MPPLSAHPRNITNKNPIRNNKTPLPTSTAPLHPTPPGWGHTGDTVQQRVALLKHSLALTGQLLGHHLVEFVTEVCCPLPLQLQLQELIVGDLGRRGETVSNGDITTGTSL